MGKLLLVVVLLGGGWLLLDRVRSESVAVRVEGRSIVLERSDFEYRFRKGGPYAEEYMIFGGHGQPMRNSPIDVSLGALAMRHARFIHARHPDFHMCKSPGAKSAQQLIESAAFVAATAGARDELSRAVSLHEERIRDGGERTCVRVRGQDLWFESATLKHDGSDVGGQVERMLGQAELHLAEHAELVDCAELLR